MKTSTRVEREVRVFMERRLRVEIVFQSEDYLSVESHGGGSWSVRESYSMMTEYASFELSG